MNPFELIRNFMTKGMTPKGIIQRMAGNNPMINNLIQMNEQGDVKGVETFARNVLKERGIDYDKEMENLKRTLKL